MSNTGIKISKKLINYIIDSSGYSVDQIVNNSKRKYIDSGRTRLFDKGFVIGLKEGSEKIPVDFLKSLDKQFFNRGLPFYFLNFVPEDNVLINFRKNEDKLSPRDRVILRRYQNLRYEIKELLEKDETKISRGLRKYTIKEDAKLVAEEIFERFGISRSEIEQLNPESVFNRLRNKIEAEGIFVFKNDFWKDRNMDISGCIFLRGELPVLILIKSEDKNRDIFTLLHEFAHYLLDEGEDPSSPMGASTSSVERWCNTFASYFLLNKKYDEILTKIDKSKLAKKDYSELDAISKKFKISKSAIIYRLHLLKIVDFEEFEKFNTNKKKITTQEKVEIKIPKVIMVKSRKSKKYLELIGESLRKNRIEVYDAMNSLELTTEVQLREAIE